jgi:hypothetical protein
VLFGEGEVNKTVEHLGRRADLVAVIRSWSTVAVRMV